MFRLNIHKYSINGIFIKRENVVYQLILVFNEYFIKQLKKYEATQFEITRGKGLHFSSAFVN